MNGARTGWPGDDDATLCAAVEREIEQWARLRRSQGSKSPGTTPARYVDYLFGHSTQRAAAACRRAEARGLLKRAPFDCGIKLAWKLTRRGSRLAEQGDLLCRECAGVPSLPDADAFDRCAACAALVNDDRAEDAEEMATGCRKWAAEHHAEAAKHRATAERFRMMATDAA